MNRMTENRIKYVTGLSSCVYRDYVLSMWLDITLKGVSIVDFFETNGLKDVVVYGYGDIGKKLIRELESSDKIRVVAVLDQKAMQLSGEIPILRPTDPIPKHDVMLVTVLDCNYVRNTLGDKSNNIVSFDEFLRGF